MSYVTVANAIRAAHGLRPLTVHRGACDAALERATTMAATHDFRHDLRPMERRFPGWWVGENMAWEINGPASVGWDFEAWMASPSHRDLVLDPAWTVAGGAWAYADDGRRYSVLCFAHP